VNYYRRYLGDYARDTMHLSMIEHGAYTVLLDSYYGSEKPLPDDYESLYRICRAMKKPEQEAVRKVADAFFKVSEDGLRHNPRADREIATAQATIAKQRESAVKSTANRTVKSQSTVTVNPESTVQQSERSTGQPPTTILQPPTAKPPTIQPTDAAPAKAASAPLNGVSKLENQSTWSAYAFAYKARYGVDPVRNSKVNGQIAQIVQRLGGTEAPQVAAFFVKHNGPFYVRAKHAVGALLKDCEGIRTEWAGGHVEQPKDMYRKRPRTVADYHENLGLGNESTAIDAIAKRVV
jgi:uncharacterized protein YdaU (DUF1376 family)